MPLREKSRQGWGGRSRPGSTMGCHKPVQRVSRMCMRYSERIQGNWVDFHEKCERQKKCKEAAARQLISIF